MQHVILRSLCLTILLSPLLGTATQQPRPSVPVAAASSAVLLAGDDTKIGTGGG